ncbi:MAG: hypothetical protein EOO77_23500 [Oxalobacteraceae bacterium]|nr:MAG: hypothetical protein EOO77_23500 [Oxalobacteraceae bacterium]
MIRLDPHTGWFIYLDYRVKLRSWSDFLAADQWCADSAREGSFMIVHDHRNPSITVDAQGRIQHGVHPLPTYAFTDPDVAFEFRLRWG